MSSTWKSVAQLTLGTVLVLAIVTYPVPGRSNANHAFEVGDAVCFTFSGSGNPWEIVAFAPGRGAVRVKRGEESAIMAIWECTPAE